MLARLAVAAVVAGAALAVPVPGVAVTLVAPAARPAPPPAPATLSGVAPRRGALPPPGPPAPREWIVVDVDTGRVVAGVDYHDPRSPASLSKLLTALIAVQDLPPSATVTASFSSATEPPSIVGMKAGQVWSLDDMLHALLMVSANDAAVALAERISGSRRAFSSEMARMGSLLALQDHPVLEDPSGLDAAGSYDGGNRISAYDLAIIARAALAQPTLSRIMSQQTYDFVAPDGTHRHLVNHNTMLSSFPGEIGGKTGFTDLAGITYMGAATRDGRTMLVVQLGASDHWVTAAQELELGFDTPVWAESNWDQLPGTTVVDPPAVGSPALLPVAKRSRTAEAPGAGPLLAGLLGGAAAALAGLVAGRLALSAGRRRRPPRHRHGRVRRVLPGRRAEAPAAAAPAQGPAAGAGRDLLAPGDPGAGEATVPSATGA